MKEIVYIKTPQCIELKEREVYLKDFLTVYASDGMLKNKIQNLHFYTFDAGQKEPVIVSILKVIELITQKFPDVSVINLGEGDFILEYAPDSQEKKGSELLFTFLICLVAFFGGGFAIMSYNTDVGSKELFTNLSMMITGNAKTGIICLVVTYAIGLTSGMILFFNHFGNKKLSSDPTPLEIQMRLYENDIGTTIIKDVSRRGENIDVKQT